MALKGGETCERGQLMIYSLLLLKKVFGSSSVDSIHDLLMTACHVYSNNDVFSLTHSPFLKARSHVLLIRLTNVDDYDWSRTTAAISLPRTNKA